MTLVLAGLQVIIEGPRWQMVPAYVLAVVFFITWLVLAFVPSKNRLRLILANRFIIGVSMCLGVIVLIISIALPIVLPVFHFPKPSGPYQIGTVTYRWTENRHELFRTNPDARRQIVAQIWYPVSGDKSSMRASYVENASAISSTFGRALGLPSFILDHFQYVTTNAIPAAPIANTQPNYPVLIFLTGVDGYRQSNTFQVENLVSHGYVVVGLDQPYVDAAVTLASGQVIPGWARDQIQPLINQSLSAVRPAPSVNSQALNDGIIPYLAGDVSFTLDQLTKLNHQDPNGILTGHLNLSHIGTFGVSLGAMIAAEACHIDVQLKACLMMDAAMPSDVVASGLRQPAMWLTRPAIDMRAEKWTESDISQTLDTMHAVYDEEPAGSGYYVQISGMDHTNFTDAPYFSPVAHLLGLAGPINSQRAFDIVNAYTLSFFSKALQSQSPALLNGSSKQYPEAKIEVQTR
jgi:hypothetical protein